MGTEGGGDTGSGGAGSIRPDPGGALSDVLSRWAVSTEATPSSRGALDAPDTPWSARGGASGHGPADSDVDRCVSA